MNAYAVHRIFPLSSFPASIGCVKNDFPSMFSEKKSNGIRERFHNQNPINMIGDPNYSQRTSMGTWVSTEERIEEKRMWENLMKISMPNILWT
jgi:hypothetical protein